MLRPPGGKNAFDFCGGLIANTENLRCIRKNIGYVCADGFWSSAEILENSLVLAKMQILQNAQSVWLWVGVCNSLLDRFGNCRIPIISGFIWKRTQTTQTQPSAAATRRSRSLTFASCCRSRFGVAFCFRE